MTSHIQSCGSYDPLTETYSISVGYEELCFTIDNLDRKDLEELQSCLSCILDSDDPRS